MFHLGGKLKNNEVLFTYNLLPKSFVRPHFSQLNILVFLQPSNLCIPAVVIPGIKRLDVNQRSAIQHVNLLYGE